MKQECKQTANSFILNQIQSEVLIAYQLMADLNYPIHDRASLKCQLEERTSQEKVLEPAMKQAIALLDRTFRAVDFPIFSPTNGLEKLFDLMPPRFILPPLDITIPDFDDRERPSIAKLYIETFGLICGQKAIDAYLAAIRQGNNELQAIIAGHMAGKRC